MLLTNIRTGSKSNLQPNHRLEHDRHIPRRGYYCDHLAVSISCVPSKAIVVEVHHRGYH